MPLPLAQTLVEQFARPPVKALVVVGSFARGDEGPYSDVDLLRFLDQPSACEAEAQTHLIDGRLVVVSDVAPAVVEEWFSSPEAASGVIAGLRAAQALLDPERVFASIQERAHAFVWDASLQQKADAWASRQMVGWIEEVHKGLAGLRSGHVGRLLNAGFGLSWGLSHVMQVQRGVLLSGDNAFYDEVAEAVGPDSEWVRLRRIAFGIEKADGRAPTLREQVMAGLHLFAATTALLAARLGPDDEPLIAQTVSLIEQEVGRNGTP